MAGLEQSNSSQQGNVGVTQATAYFQWHGCIPSMPPSDAQYYDFLVDVKHKVAKVQVKTTTHRKNSENIYTADLRTCNRPIDLSKIDYLFVLTGDCCMYCIPANKMTSTTSIDLNEEMQQYLVSVGGVYIQEPPSLL